MSSGLTSVDLNDRRTFIGGSDAAAILGISPWRTPYQVWAEKVGVAVEQFDAARERRFQRGKKLEPYVREMLVDELRARGHEVEIIRASTPDLPNRVIWSEHAFIAAEIDVELFVDGEHVNGEIKTVHGFAAKDWGEQGTDEIPVYYTAQTMHGLMVTGRRRAVVAALVGTDDLRIHRIERDEETIAGIEAREVDFWQRYVVAAEPPPPTNSEDVSRMFSRESIDAVETDQSCGLALAELKIVRQNIKTLSREQERLEMTVKQFMGSAAVLTTDGAKVATWKTEKPRFSESEFRDAHPDLYEKFRKPEGSRVFRIS